MEEQLFNLASRGGIVGLLGVILLGLFRRWIVLGWQYEALRKERDEWKALALEASGLAEMAAAAAGRRQ